MQILVVSNIGQIAHHTPAESSLLEQVRLADADAIVLVGNLGAQREGFEATLQLFVEFEVPVGVITGNRDLWSRPEGNTSQALWEQVIPEGIDRHRFVWLEKSNIVVGRIGICGTMAWYDYSGRETGLGYTLEQYHELKGLVEEDAKHIDWHWSDIEFAGLLQEAFADRLEMLNDDREIDRILVVTHYPVFKEAMPPPGPDIQMRFRAAYSSNLTIGRTIAPKLKVHHVVSTRAPASGEWDVTFGTNQFTVHAIGGDDHLAVISFPTSDIA